MVTYASDGNVPFRAIADIRVPAHDAVGGMMSQIEVYEGKDDKPLFTSEFAFAPRIGEHISREMGGYFNYYDVIEAWHRDEAGSFVACVRVTLRD